MEKNKSKSILFIVISSLLAVVVMFCATFCFMTSCINVKYGDTEIYEFIALPERTEKSFEDSSIFSRIVYGDLNEITRMCVIRNQMETNGRYDAKKKIDITKYANRTKPMQTSGKSVEFYLDDLIKWGNYGFDYEMVEGSDAQLDTVFYALTVGDESYSLPGDNTFHEGEWEEYGVNDGDFAVLINRYTSCEGKKLIEYASNREEYGQLLNELKISAFDLFSNYSEYEGYNDTYGENMTNVSYCYQLTGEDGKVARYTNLGMDVSKLSNDDITDIFGEYGKYIYYIPDKMQMISNIEGVSSTDLRDIVSDYRYSFRDNSRMWIAVDTKYPCDDIYVEAKAQYGKSDDMFVPIVIGAMVSALMYLFVIVLMTICAGRYQTEDENNGKSICVKPCKVDKMPIEAWIIASFILGFGAMCIVGVTFSCINMLPSSTALVLLCIEALVANVILTPMYLILVRKIKCKLMWNGSILQHICIKVRKLAINMYDNGEIIVRVWLVYLLFLAVNLVLVLLGGGGIVIAFIFDLGVGYIRYKESKTREKIVDGISIISKGDTKHKIDTEGMHGDNLILAESVNSIGDGIRIAVEKSMKDEKLKADLITNVSHDIKTPLTSIINYVDLIKRENVENEKIKSYVDVLDKKSLRLKQLIDDLVEASKISSGNINLCINKINLTELVNQTLGEFVDKFEEKHLNIVWDNSQNPLYILADPRGIYRVIENLYNNVYKYAMPNTRVYINTVVENGMVRLEIKNISMEPLGISADELTERFIRGDQSRKTEGSGLGLSIAKNLTIAMNGTFDIVLDGDLFKAVIAFELK
ncbi:MAG: HAMP domain-containing histidine kinase [Lachnospiraceae bacterium]|nr:HAMP domain-containing histidine kinase [Candidatus Colinaster equi]